MFSIALSIFVVFATTMCAQSTETTKLSGTVTDISGASVGAATIDVRWNVARANGPAHPVAANSVVMTDQLGGYFVNLTPGFYDVCVHAAGFSAACTTVAIGEQPGPMFKTVLKPDSLITSERADLFGILDVGPNLSIPTVPPDFVETIPIETTPAVKK